MYQFKECGLDNIYLKNGYKYFDTPEGRGVSIHDLDNLHKTIAEGIAKKKAPISGKEFRFLRVELDLSQKALGHLIGKTDQMIAKWEKGEAQLPVLADKAIRDLYLESIGQGPLAGILRELSELDRQYHERKLELEETQDGWKFGECA